LVLNNVAFAQNTVVGIVRDTSDNPLSAVSVRLVTDLDTFTRVTNEMGAYEFENIRGNTIYLTFNVLGYRAGYQSMFVLKDHGVVEVPTMLMEPMNFMIKEVRVIKPLPMVVKGDTIQFNFDAFNFRQNSLLEESIKKLPGISVSRNGAVYHNGVRIQKVRVDNKDFFGGNLLTATRNLPTEIIESLQVIEDHGKVDEATGLKNNKPEKIINIILRPNRKQIYFGQVTVGGGTNERYLGSFGINRFNNGRELSIIGSTNNTNTNMFYLGGLYGNDRRQSLTDVGDYADPVDGLNKVNSIGVNLSDQLSKSFSITASYNYTRKKNTTDGFSQLTSSYVGNTIRRKEDYVLNTVDDSHNFKFALSGAFANRDQLKIDGNFLFNTQETFNTKNTEITNAQMSNRGTYEGTTRLTTPNGDLDAVYSKYFKNPNRKLVSELKLRSNNLRRKELVDEQYLEIGQVDGGNDHSVYLQDQMINQNNVTNSARASLTYIEPFLDFGRFEFNYTFDITGIDAVRTVYDRLDSQHPTYIDSLAINYDYYFKNNHVGLNYHMEVNDKVKFSAGFGVEPITLKGKLLFDETDYTYENINLLPSANLWYKITKDLDWQFNYRGKNNQPNFNQIAPIVDNSNSRNIFIGNPGLKAESAHRFSTRIRKAIPSRAQYFETSFAYNIITNKIVSDKSSLANSTIQQTTFRNTSGYYDTRWFYVFNTPVITDDIQLDLTGNLDFYNHPSFIDDRKRLTLQLLFSQALQMKYLWNDYFESSFIANYNLNNAQYDIPYRTNISVHTMQMGLNTRTYVGDNFSFGAEMSQRFNDGYTNSFMNSNQTMINAFVEYSFLPNKVGLLRLQGFDLLDQNKDMGFYSEYIGNDVYEARNSRLGQYFMLSFNLRIQKYPKNK
jgi:hypothetical protein